MRVADLRGLSIFDGLSDDQLAELVAAGTEVRVEPGVELFHEGEHADFWWVLVDGALDLIRHVGREGGRVRAVPPPPHEACRRRDSRAAVHRAGRPAP